VKRYAPRYRRANHAFDGQAGNPAAIRRLPAALRVKQRAIQLNGIAAIGFAQAVDDLRKAFSGVAGVIKAFSHGCPPLCQDSILILLAAIIPPDINAILLRKHK
jgi:hypothetical protein